MKLAHVYAGALSAVAMTATMAAILTASQTAQSETPASNHPVEMSNQAGVTHQLITIGDSISAAFIGYTATKPNLAGQQPSPLAHETLPGEVPPPHVENGVRVPAALESKAEYAWSTGQKIDSIARRIQAYLYLKDTKNKLGWMNLAESGGLVEHMPRQARWAMEDQAKLNPNGQIALVTLMIGSNDACARLESTPAEAVKIREDLRKTFEHLAKGRPASQTGPVPVSVSSLPKIYELGRPEIRAHKVTAHMTCADVRREIRDSCPRLSNWKTPEELAIRKARTEWVNAVIRTATFELAPEFPELSIAWDNQMAEYTLEGPDLAADCFHPGKRGQAKIADMLWSGMPWFN